MESPSLAAVLISILAFLDVVFSQDSQQLSYLLRGRPAFGDRSGFDLGPRQYVFESGNTLGAASDASSSYGSGRFAIVPDQFERDYTYGAGRFGILPGGFERDYTGRGDGVENFGNSDTIPYGGIKRTSRRRAILIVIRRRRPLSQGGSGSEDNGGKWGRQDDDYASDDQSTNQRRRAGRALLGLLLKKLLLAAASRRLPSDGSDEGQGRDFRSEQPWRRSDRGWRSGWRFSEGSDSGSTESYDGRESRWPREGRGAEGGRLLVRVIRPNAGDSSGFYLVGSGRGPQSGAGWISNENTGRTSGGIPGISSEESGPISDIASSDAGYSVVRNVGRISTGGQGNQFTGMPSFLRGILAGSRGFEGSTETATAQPSTRPELNSFEQPSNQAGYRNEDSAYGGMGSNYYPLMRPRLIIRFPHTFTPSSQTGSPGENYESSFGGSPDTAGNTAVSGSPDTAANSRYSSPFGRVPGANPMSTSAMSGPYSVSNSADGSAPNVNAQLPQKS